MCVRWCEVVCAASARRHWSADWPAHQQYQSATVTTRSNQQRSAATTSSTHSSDPPPSAPPSTCMQPRIPGLLVTPMPIVGCAAETAAEGREWLQRENEHTSAVRENQRISMRTDLEVLRSFDLITATKVVVTLSEGVCPEAKRETMSAESEGWQQRERANSRAET